jgi:HEAT repeat protein
MIDVTCPKCGVELEVADSKAGARVTCPDCDCRILVPARTATKPARPSAKAPAGRPAPPPPRGKRPPRRRDDDYDDEESGSNGKLILGLSLGGVGLLCIVGVVLFLVLRGKDSKDKKEEVAANTNNNLPANFVPPRMGAPPAFGPGNPNLVPPVTNPNANPNAGSVPNPKDPPKKDPATRTTTPVAGSGASREEIYQHVLKSTVLILVPTQGGIAAGTGSLIDAKNRLVLTNFHVVMSAPEVAALFPIYDEQGDPVQNRETYIKKLTEQRDSINKAQVVAKDDRRDLALIQLAEIPKDVLPLAVAEKSVKTGQAVHSLGNPGRGGMVWVYAPGQVRGISAKYKWRAGSEGGGQVLNLESDVVMTDSPTNPGDSGGPLVNGRGELVGVTHGLDPEGRGISLFIERNEVVDFIESYCRSKGLAWDRADRHLEGGGPGEADMPTLMADLKNADAQVRSRAAQTLGAMGPKAKMAVPALGGLLKDKDELPRRFALQALAKIGPDASPAADDLLAVLKDSDANVRQEAAKALGKIGPTIKAKAFGPLAKSLDDKERSVRLAAVEAIASLGPLDPADLPVVLKVLQGGDDEIKGYAAKALGQFSTSAKDVVPALIDAYKSTRAVQLQAAVLASLAHFGEEAKVALPQVSDALKSGNADLIRPASRVAAGIGTDAQKLVPELAAALDGRDPVTRKEVLGALVKLGPLAKEAVQALSRGLAEKDREARNLTLSVLEALGKDAKPAVPALTQLFADRNKDLDAKVIAVLTKVGKDGVPELRIALRNSNPFVRMGVCKALGSIGPPARAAAQDLGALGRTDQYLEVQQEAQQAYLNVIRKP